MDRHLRIRRCAALAAALITSMSWADPSVPERKFFVPQSDQLTGPPGCALCRDTHSWRQVAPRSLARDNRPPLNHDGNRPHSRLAPDQDSSARLNGARLPDLPFRDREPLINRLKSIQSLPFLTLWDSGEATVYVGVDRRGRPGLHLRQKREAIERASPAEGRWWPSAPPSAAEATVSK